MVPVLVLVQKYALVENDTVAGVLNNQSPTATTGVNTTFTFTWDYDQTVDTVHAADATGIEYECRLSAGICSTDLTHENQADCLADGDTWVTHGQNQNFFTACENVCDSFCIK